MGAGQPNSIVTLGFPAATGIKLPEYAAVSTAANGVIKAEPVSGAMTTQQNGVVSGFGAVASSIKTEAGTNQGINASISFPPLIKAEPGNNVVQLGMQLPGAVMPPQHAAVTLSNDIYRNAAVAQQQNYVAAQAAEPSQQKATSNNTDGDYLQPENVSQLGGGGNGAYGMVQDEGGMSGGVDNGSLITNAMNSLNTIANCQLSA